ncbi:hypothetical protein EI555_012558 [Monodon monoceros]|uniref:Trefoil factor 3 n=1 Tax=Monodon monoceros TaxID=40151 RepID=A0A4U1FB64_MONMO|nr:hypothetical protein EI555_012558 [Monodon monoceros]
MSSEPTGPQSPPVTMEARTFWLLVMVLPLVSSSSTGQYVSLYLQPVDRPQASKGSDWALFGTAPNQCMVPAKDRMDCAYPDVTPEQCTNRGCCFDSSISGVPWCFKPLQEAGESAPHARGTFPGSQEATHT